MSTNTVFATLHHLSVLALWCCALTTRVQLGRPLSPNRLRLLQRVDLVNGMAATAVLLAGLVRLLYLEKEPDYYFHSAPFVAKLVLYGVASGLSLVPTLEVVRWCAMLKQGLTPALGQLTVVRLRRVASAQLACLFLMTVCASLAARGMGV